MVVVCAGLAACSPSQARCAPASHTICRSCRPGPPNILGTTSNLPSRLSRAQTQPITRGSTDLFSTTHTDLPQCKQRDPRLPGDKHQGWGRTRVTPDTDILGKQNSCVKDENSVMV